MQKFSTILLAVLGLLGRPMVPLHHTHAGEHEPAHHDAVAHFHVHDHSHEHHSHDEHHALPCDEDDVSTEGLTSEHDSDAVYVGEFVASIVPYNSFDAKHVSLQADVPANIVPLISVAMPPPDAVAVPPPGAVSDGIPIFLRNLSLRI